MEWYGAYDNGRYAALKDERRSIVIRPDLCSEDRGERAGMYIHIKRAITVVIALLGLAVVWPLMLLIAIAVKVDDPQGPVLFRQQRLGYKGREFSMLKFRSMRVGTERTGSGVYSDNNDPRVTRVGRIIRATSLDELPQLINMLTGDMSLIGPRPPLTYHPWPIGQYDAEQMHMFDVRPGLTGWAQIHGRRSVEWHERIKLNIWYVDHLSFMLDLRIFFSTFFKVLAQKDNENTGKTV